MKSGTTCIATLKPGQTHCRAHDPARAAERSAAAGIRRQPGDPGTELGTYQGIARRAARVLDCLENGVVLAPGERGERLEPLTANAMLNVLRFLAQMVRIRAAEPKPKTGDGPQAPYDLERELA